MSSMVSPNDEVELKTQVAGLDVKLDGAVESVGKLDGKFDVLSADIRGRFDTIYPKLAVLETEVRANADDIAELKTALKEQRGTLRSWVQLLVAAILGGGLSYAIADMWLKSH